MSTIGERLVDIIDVVNIGGLYTEAQAESFVSELEEYLDLLPENVREDGEVVDELLELVSMLYGSDEWLSGADSEFFNDGFFSLAIKYIPDYNEVAETLDVLCDSNASEREINQGFRDLVSTSFVMNDLDDVSVFNDHMKLFTEDIRIISESTRNHINDLDVSKMLDFIRVCMHSVNVNYFINMYDVKQFKDQLNEDLRDVVVFKEKLNKIIDMSEVRRGYVGSLSWPLRAEIRSLYSDATDLENRKWY